MFKNAAVVLSLALLAGCTSDRPQQGIENHDEASVQIRGLEREVGQGPYVTGATETFKLQADEGIRSVRWNATAGTLNASGDRASWKLPQPGVATISATVITRDGEEKTASWDFLVVSTDDNLSRARDALLAAPISVLDGGSDTTGSQCDLAYESGGTNIHLVFRNDTHPSIHYGFWNGTTWNIQLVDGMGFNTGGLVTTGKIKMILDPSNVPHIVYELENKGLWYATKSGANWIRERVDTTTPTGGYGEESILLNPAASNRPTVVYTAVSPTYNRVIVAARTGANTWTNTTLSFGFTTGNQTMDGDPLFDSAGRLYVPLNSYWLGAWNGTTTEYLSVYNATANNTYFDTWAQSTWGATGKLLFRTNANIIQITPAATLSTSTTEWSAVEQSGTAVGDLAYSGKPYLLHQHGSNLELVTHNAQNFWTYTQLGTNGGNNASLAVNAAGNPSICYQYNSRVTFQ